jgi:hypothetical protein
MTQLENGKGKTGIRTFFDCIILVLTIGKQKLT